MGFLCHPFDLICTLTFVSIKNFNPLLCLITEVWASPCSCATLYLNVALYVIVSERMCAIHAYTVQSHTHLLQNRNAQAQD